ncbi:hypothetical protein [Streptacidiphilus sp. PAMC 29251]
MTLRRFTRADADDLAVLHGHATVMRSIDNGRPVPRAVVEQQQLPDILREYDDLPVGLGPTEPFKRLLSMGGVDRIIATASGAQRPAEGGPAR